MRTIHLFPAADRDTTSAALDSLALPDGSGGWKFSDLAWLRLETAGEGLYGDWPEEDVASLSAALEAVPEWAVVADLSVRATPESLRPLLHGVLAEGGVVVDDNSAVPWSVNDIERGARQPAFIAFVRD